MAIWEQRGADFSSFNLVTLGWVCPHSVAQSSNGCNTLEDLITIQAVLRDSELVKAICLLFAAIPLEQKPPFCLSMKVETRAEQSGDHRAEKINNLIIKLRSLRAHFKR